MSWFEDRVVSLSVAPFVIAEIGVNHDGRVDQAAQLIDEAARAGASAVKLQYFTARALLSREARLAAYQRETGAKDPAAMLESLELPMESLPGLVERMHALSLVAIVTAFSIEHVDDLAAMEWDAFKVASPDLVNTPLLSALARTQRPVILSTGAATGPEIASTLSRFGDAVLHCTSAYPTAAGETNLRAIGSLASLVRAIHPDRTIPVGLSDHTDGLDTGALAVAAGARILEKHFTHDRSAAGPDHRASLDAVQLAAYIDGANDAHVRMGSAHLACAAVERDVRTVSRQSVTTRRAMRAGHVIERCDLTIKRPGTGIGADQFEAVIGATLLKDVEADVPLRADDVCMASASGTAEESRCSVLTS